MKKALITGITGQAGSYLAEFLLDKGYEVVGVYRRSSVPTFERIEHIRDDRFKLVCGDITDYSSINTILTKERPDEVYNLAAQSHVGVSFAQPILTWDVTAQGCVNILESLRHLYTDDYKPRFYQASSSEMFGAEYDTRLKPNPKCPQSHMTAMQFEESKKYGGVRCDCIPMISENYQDENTRMVPQSPYAVAKLAAHNMTTLYRRSYGMYTASGILFNHESPRRGENFVTRKITKYVAQIHNEGLAFGPYIRNDDRFVHFGDSNIDSEKLAIPKLKLGNLDASRDWGFAGDYCVDLDTPILTTTGWRFHNEIEAGDEVLNFNPNSNTIEKDEVVEKIITTSEGIRYRFIGQGVDFTCTPNHRIYFQTKSKSSNGGWSDWKILTAREMFEKFNDLSSRSKYDYRFPGFVKYNNDEDYNIDDDILYLLGCLVAEGSIEHHNPGSGIRVSISQSYIVNERIHSKIQGIIDRLGLVCRVENRNDGVTQWIFDSESSIRLLEYFDSANIHILPSYIYKLSARQCQIIFDAMMDCDGCWGNLSYTSKRYKLATDFQTIAALCGYRTSSFSNRNNCYVIQLVAKRKQYYYVQSIEENQSDNDIVWCVRTNNKTIVTRQNDLTFISGNCEAMWLMLQQERGNDFVIATGETKTVREFCQHAFSHIGLNWEDFVVVDPEFMRPAEVPFLKGDASRAKYELGWTPKTTFAELAQMMVEADING